jgi:tRNA-dihydrouridine synthase
MKIYFAPLEGVTGYIYRNAYEEFYGKGQIDKYFIPFISPNKTNGFTAREMQDINPDHNKGLPLAVQIMTNRSDYFISAVENLYGLGYSEVNLNLGCPSGTVVAKKRGAGFLSVPDELDAFFSEIFESPLIRDGKVKVSAKTRLGMENPSEFDRLLDIYNSYPLSELIIHPRVQKDYYKNKPDMEAFAKAVDLSKNPVCYNGDIFTLTDFCEFTKAFPQVERVMLGRGFLADPGLISGILAACRGEKIVRDAKSEQLLLQKFDNRLYTEYLKIMSGDKNAIHKMKELWTYQVQTFENAQKPFKKIRKSQKMCDYEAAVSEFYSQAELVFREHLYFG